MKALHLVLREIRFRKLGFALAVLSVAAATACVVWQLILLHKHDLRTDQIIATKEAQTRKQMAALQDDYRKITKNLGFNVLILPAAQNLGDLYADDFASKFMPESYVDKLAKSKVATIQHLLPSLQQKVKWPERERTVLALGVRGEVPIGQGDPKKPILETVPAGSMVLGYELHRGQNIKTGDTVKFMGRDFKVTKTQPERGTKDDITLWINLREAQELFNKKGLINGIMALECVCAADSLAKIRAEISKILPDTQVIEFQTQAIARAEARQRAAVEASQSVEHERVNRSKLRSEREGFAAIVVPVAITGAGLWIGLLSWGNVRQRRSEIGILRAIGVRGGQIMGIVLSRAIVSGILGAALGAGLGVLAGVYWNEPDTRVPVPAELIWKMLGLSLGAAPVLAALAGWFPALSAAQQDPAAILGEE